MMNEIKFLEIRDRATFIPVLAYKLTSEYAEGRYLLARSGFSIQYVYVAMTVLTDMKTNYTASDWNESSRTRQVAHEYITKHFDELTTGDVIDVEYILGETDTKKVSERCPY